MINSLSLSQTHTHILSLPRTHALSLSLLGIFCFLIIYALVRKFLADIAEQFCYLHFIHFCCDTIFLEHFLDTLLNAFWCLFTYFRDFTDIPFSTIWLFPHQWFWLVSILYIHSPISLTMAPYVSWGGKKISTNVVCQPPHECVIIT